MWSVHSVSVVHALNVVNALNVANVVTAASVVHAQNISHTNLAMRLLHRRMATSSQHSMTC
jgi:hypothetical protein